MSELSSCYKELKPKFEKLRINICSVIEQMLKETDIAIFSVESRLKDESSFIDKATRKGYTSPLDQIEDICGIRVICYYQEDINRICSIIKNEFDIVSEENKQEKFNHDQFGYSSFHYIVKLKETWLEHPSVRGLGGLKAEIQIRTMLMHSWAAISHKLLYKNESDVEPKFKRKLSRLSALIELADEQFNALKNEKHLFQQQILSADNKFDTSAELSSDSLIALREYYFKSRELIETDIPNLVDEVRSCNYSLTDLIAAIERCLPILDDMENYEFSNKKDITFPVWAFSGVIRTILDLTCNQYYENREVSLPAHLKEAREKFRSIIFN